MITGPGPRDAELTAKAGGGVWPGPGCGCLRRHGLGRTGKHPWVWCLRCPGSAVSGPGSQWHNAIEQFMTSYVLLNGTRSIELKGSKLWYRTLQCTSGACTCKYNYEGTSRNPLFNIERTTPFKEATEWLHECHKVPRQEHFNQCVANVYDRQADQAIPRHSDKMTCWGRQGTL